MIQQRSIKTSIRATGLGLHSGSKVLLTLRPAPPNTGIVFRRVDLSPCVEILAKPENVLETELATSLGKGEHRISTVEHLMSAFAGLGIDNCVVEVDRAEVPVMDGSAAPFVFLLQSAGVVDQGAAKRFIRITKPVEVELGDKWARVSPHQGFKLDFSIDFDHPAVRATKQSLQFDFANASFVKEISRARTFGFMRDFELLREKGLARGASMENAVALDADRVMNDEGLRYSDEFVRHKALDAIGDLYMMGHCMLAKLEAHKAGHHLNNLLAREVMQRTDCWEWQTFEGEAKEASPFAVGGADLIFA
ncbi:MAG: UDP-3-O-acyl-N-acetylglucosamine deacetylase [Granulosicoccaceae bacterium]